MLELFHGLSRPMPLRLFSAFWLVSLFRTHAQLRLHKRSSPIRLDCNINLLRFARWLHPRACDFYFVLWKRWLYLRFVHDFLKLLLLEFFHHHLNGIRALWWLPPFLYLRRRLHLIHHYLYIYFLSLQQTFVTLTEMLNRLYHLGLLPDESRLLLLLLLLLLILFKFQVRKGSSEIRRSHFVHIIHKLCCC